MTEICGFIDGQRVRWNNWLGNVDTSIERNWIGGGWVPVRFDNGNVDGIRPEGLVSVDEGLSFHGFKLGERVYWERRGLGRVVDPEENYATNSGTLLANMLAGTRRGNYVPIEFDNGYTSNIRDSAIRSRCPRKANR